MPAQTGTVSEEHGACTETRRSLELAGKHTHTLASFLSVRPPLDCLFQVDHHPATGVRSRNPSEFRTAHSVNCDSMNSDDAPWIHGGARNMKREWVKAANAPVVHGGAPRPDGRLRPVGGLGFPAKPAPAISLGRSCTQHTSKSDGQAWHQSDGCTSSHCFLNEPCSAKLASLNPHTR